MSSLVPFRLRAALLLGVSFGLVSCQANEAVSTRADERETQALTAEVHRDDSPVPTPAATTPPSTEVTGETIEFGTVDGKKVSGYLARPRNSKRPLPGLIVIHEWWGLNDNIRGETRRLAAQGYVALAVDLYEGNVAARPPEAMKLMQNLTANTGPAERTLLAAYDYLERVEHAPRIASIGWCMGGRWSLTTALLLPEQLDAAVIYYGTVKADEAALARLTMPVIGFFAEKDPVVPVPSVREFESTMKRLGKDVQVKIYEGAEHGFANPSGTAYNAAAAEDAWQLTTRFLQKRLQVERR